MLQGRMPPLHAWADNKGCRAMLVLLMKVLGSGGMVNSSIHSTKSILPRHSRFKQGQQQAIAVYARPSACRSNLGMCHSWLGAELMSPAR